MLFSDILNCVGNSSISIYNKSEGVDSSKRTKLLSYTLKESDVTAHTNILGSDEKITLGFELSKELYIFSLDYKLKNSASVDDVVYDGEYAYVIKKWLVYNSAIGMNHIECIAEKLPQIPDGVV